MDRAIRQLYSSDADGNGVLCGRLQCDIPRGVSEGQTDHGLDWFHTEQCLLVDGSVPGVRRLLDQFLTFQIVLDQIFTFHIFLDQIFNIFLDQIFSFRILPINFHFPYFFRP